MEQIENVNGFVGGGWLARNGPLLPISLLCGSRTRSVYHLVAEEQTDRKV